MADNMFKHKDILGSIKFSPEEDCFYGEILGIKDQITYKGESIKTLRVAFIEAVEGYINEGISKKK